ncbi:MAG: hypothetical protein ACLQPH_16585 [Acidimicrobiales bacterium]
MFGRVEEALVRADYPTVARATRGPAFGTRQPLPFQTSTPGVVSDVDVRPGSMKRVACELEVADLTIADYEQCVSLIETYADMGLGMVDASVVAVAENLRVTSIATLNERDFRVVKARHAATFQLLPLLRRSPAAGDSRQGALLLTD